jgi:hypothetical protein
MIRRSCRSFVSSGIALGIIMSFNAVARSMLKPLLIFILAAILIIAGLGFVSTNRARASGTTITVNSLSDDQTAGTGACV